MEIKIGDYTIKSSTYQWTLSKEEELVNEKGEKYVRVDNRYFPNLGKALLSFINESLKDEEGVKEASDIIDKLNQIEKLIFNKLAE